MDKQKIVNKLIIVIALAAIAFGGYFYYQLRILKTDPQTTAKKEADDLVSKVSRLYLLPTGEDPTVATVSDPDVLKNQSFFTQSLKGDKVLIYSKAGKAILYRPSLDKIIETAPISKDTKANAPVSTTETPSVESKNQVTPTVKATNNKQ